MREPYDGNAIDRTLRDRLLRQPDTDTLAYLVKPKPLRWVAGPSLLLNGNRGHDGA